METLATLLARKAALDIEIERETLIAYYVKQAENAMAELPYANSSKAPELRTYRDECARIIGILADNRTNGLSLKDAKRIAGL